MAQRILGLIQQQPYGKQEIARQLGKAGRTRYLNELVRRMMEANWIEYTIPHKPNSRLQKYRLTDKGRKHIEEKQP
jgi:ATP-dependent DNA helicase RecG